MNRIIVLLLLVLVATGCARGVTQQLSFPIDENSNYDSICGNVSVTINFRNLNLNTIKENFLSSPIITCLDLSGTHITTIDINAFNNLPNLRYLNMSKNSFDFNVIFSNNYLNLETLILDDNVRIHGGLTSNATYPKLKRLFIRNSMSSVFFEPNNSFKTAFPSLTHLYLSRSRVFQDRFEWLPNTLEYLDLTSHQLSDLTLQNLDNLQYLILSKLGGPTLNNLKLKNLKNLKYLSATSNMLREVTNSTFSGLRSMVYLDISRNEIKYLQRGSFDDTKNLQLLNLSSNDVTSIEVGTFDRLENLEILALEKNQISKVNALASESKLKTLYLNCNKLKMLIDGAFVNMPHLENLYLHGNEISYIDRDAFLGLSKLKTLTLSNNLLSSLPFDWMLPMASIKDLDLAGNLIYDFAKLRLDASSSIEYLYLSTQLKVIVSKSLDSVPKNLTVNVDPTYLFSEKCMR